MGRIRLKAIYVAWLVYILLQCVFGGVLAVAVILRVRDSDSPAELAGKAAVLVESMSWHVAAYAAALAASVLAGFVCASWSRRAEYLNGIVLSLAIACFECTMPSVFSPLLGVPLFVLVIPCVLLGVAIRKASLHVGSSTTVVGSCVSGGDSAKVTGLAILLFIMLYCVHVGRYGVVTPVAWVAGKTWLNKPEVYVVPQPLAYQEASTNSGFVFQCYGYSFETPWLMVSTKTGLCLGATIVFSNGPTLCVSSPFHEEGMLGEWRNRFSNTFSCASILFGEDAVTSEFDLLKAILYSKPSDLRFLMHGREALNNVSRLLTKNAIHSAARTHFGKKDDYQSSVKIEEFRYDKCWGFQVTASTSNVFHSLMVFDDGPPITMFLLWHRVATNQADQAAVNRILSTFKRVEP